MLRARCALYQCPDPACPLPRPCCELETLEGHDGWLVCKSILALSHLTQGIIALNKDAYAGIPTHQPPAGASGTVLDRLLKLDSYTQPGLLEADFMALFSRCTCGLFMTRRVFDNHECAKKATQVIIISDSE